MNRPSVHRRQRGDDVQLSQFTFTRRIVMRTILVSAITVAALLGATVALAQQPPSGQPHDHSQATPQLAQPQTPAAAPGGAPMGGRHGATAGGGQGGMMDGMPCHHMMGGGMMPMMGASDPRTMSQMLQMRGEMMRAMGEIMMKHGKAMEGSPAK